MDSKMYVIAFVSALCLGLISSLPSNSTHSGEKAPDAQLPEHLPQIIYSSTKISSVPTTSSTTKSSSVPNIPSTTKSNSVPNTPSTTIETSTELTTLPSTTNNNTSSETTKTPSSTTVTAPTTHATSNGTTKVSGHTTPQPFINERQFDGPSFIGGIVLTVGLTGIGLIAFKYFRASRMGKEPDYRNL